jgi:hypothetical protein
MRVSQKVVTPVKTEVQGTYNWWKEPDSTFRRMEVLLLHYDAVSWRGEILVKTVRRKILG